MNGCRRVAGFDPKAVKETLNQWALSECAKAVAEVAAGIEAYKFNEAALAAYRFVWNVFCDWTLELAKPVLQGADSPAKDETRATIAFIFDEICKLLHPFMPFLTEELWAIKGAGGPEARDDPGARRPGRKLDHLDRRRRPRPRSAGWSISSPRSAPPGRRPTCRPARRSRSCWSHPPPTCRTRAGRWGDIVKRLARLSEISFADARAEELDPAHHPRRGGGPAAGGRRSISLPSAPASPRKSRSSMRKSAKIDAKLGNADFLKRAPEEVVEEQRERREEAVARKAKMEEALCAVEGRVRQFVSMHVITGLVPVISIRQAQRFPEAGWPARRPAMTS